MQKQWNSKLKMLQMKKVQLIAEFQSTQVSIASIEMNTTRSEIIQAKAQLIS